MTQSIINNLNNLGEVAANNSAAAKASSCDTKTKEDNFNNEFQNKLAQNTKVTKDLTPRKSSFIGRNNYTSSPKDNIVLQDFGEIIDQECSNAGIESALNLTLDKDISDIIAQLNKLLKKVSDSDDNTELNTDTDSDSNTDSENTNEINDSSTTEEEASITENPADTEKTLEILLTEEFPVSDNTSTLQEQIAVLSNTPTNTIVQNDSEQNTKDEVNIETNKIVFEDSEVLEESEPIIKSENQTTKTDLEDFGLDNEALNELKIESIKVEADAGENSSLMQKQSPEEYAIKTILNQESNTETFEVKLTSTQTAQQVQKPQGADISPSKIIEQITKQMETLQNNSRVNIVLNPASLGKINIQLINNGNGLNAQLTVNSQEVRDLLMKGLDGLKETLASHGIGVDNVQIKVSDTEKSSYNQDWTEQEDSKGGNKNQEKQNKEEKEKGLFEKTLAQTNNDDNENGNV